MMRTRDAAISVIHIESGSEVLVTSEDPKVTNRAFSETLGAPAGLGGGLKPFLSKTCFLASSPSQTVMMGAYLFALLNRSCSARFSL